MLKSIRRGHVEAAMIAADSLLSIDPPYLLISETAAPGGGNSSTFTIEIRKGSSGSAIVSPSYTLSADREDF